ncbi:MAG: hypothetical protein PHP28_09080 [Actinomycetota bacterium]|jgi:hypothetical protein|nr:hypothetical protein [Actinomycetota bacterium]MDD5667486.1 hypothetical protein [Actinomycetota bacterium]
MRSISILGKRIRPAWLLIAGLVALAAISAVFEGPRTVYAHAIII